jgi:hypothetical protein
MSVYFFKKGDYLWFGEADTSDDAYRLCVKEMKWNMDDEIKFAGKDLSAEKFLAYRYHCIFQSPVQTPSMEGYQPGFVDGERNFLTKQDVEKKLGIDPMDDLPVYPVPKKLN